MGHGLHAGRERDIHPTFQAEGLARALERRRQRDLSRERISDDRGRRGAGRQRESGELAVLLQML